MGRFDPHPEISSALTDIVVLVITLLLLDVCVIWMLVT